MLPKEHSADWVRAIEHAVSRIEATVIVPGQTPEQLRDAIRQRVKDIAAPTYVVPDGVMASQQPEAWMTKHGLYRHHDEMQAEREAAYRAGREDAGAEAPRKSLNAMAADLLRPYLKPGQKVIWREAFRWHDDNGVLSNHYDGMELPALAEDFGYDWEYEFDFKHAAIVWRKGADAAIRSEAPREKGDERG